MKLSNRIRILRCLKCHKFVPKVDEDGCCEECIKDLEAMLNLIGK